jgi:hypothetical protein
MKFNIFSKKSKKPDRNKETKNKAEISLNKREYERYFIEGIEIEGIGSVLDVSNKGFRVKKEKPEDIEGELFEIPVEDKTLKVAIAKQDSEFIEFEFLEDFNVFNYVKEKIRKFKTVDIKSDKTIDKKVLIEFQGKDNLRKVINLMAELEDPNTNSDKLIAVIEEIPEVEEQIIAKANSIEVAGQEPVKDLLNALVRLGLDEVKRISKEVIIKKLSIADNTFPNFSKYEAFNILKTLSFKEMSPLFSFRDIRSEGKSLLSTETVGLSVQKILCGEDFIKNYVNSKFLYSYPARVLESVCSNKDLLEVNRIYYLEIIDSFKFLYDGYIIAHMNLYPYYKLPEDLKISLSNRKLRFSFAAYLSFMTTIYILDKDREIGYLLVNRLKRLGMNSNKAIKFLNQIVFEGNQILENIGLRKSLKAVSFPTFSYNLQSMFPQEIHFNYLHRSFSKIIDKKIKRVALRFDDFTFGHYVLHKFLNSPEFDFNTKSFCVIPCANLEDEDILLEVFSGFDYILFQEIDKLPDYLFKDFLNLWEKFEGTIFVTYSSYSFIDFERRDLFNLLKNYIVYLPSPFASEKVYKSVLEHSENILKSYFENIEFNKEKFSDGIYDMNSVIKSTLNDYLTKKID